jgi:uncharacterized protein (DUF2141 family)
MITIFIRFMKLTVLSIVILASTQAQQLNGTLIIHAEQFQNTKGKALVWLYREGDDVPKKPYMKDSSLIADGKSTIIFRNIPFDDYALIVFQDENSNGILDHSWGLPAEPMGFSNGWKLTLFSGMPSFTKLKFNFSKESTEVTIHLAE